MQKTAYEMRISDWSSDVCSSDLHIVQQLAGVLDLGTAGSVYFDQVDEAPFIDLSADRTLATRRGADTGFAVAAFGDDPRDGGFTHPASAGKQIGDRQSGVQGKGVAVRVNPVARRIINKKK